MNAKKKHFSADSGYILRFSISREKQEIKEFHDKKFLTRKTGKKNEKLK